MTTTPEPRAWRVAIALALALPEPPDWARWAAGLTNPIGSCPHCSREYPAIRTHTHCPPCFESTAWEVDTKLRIAITPVPAPWDAAAYLADCARRGVEPGPLPSLSLLWTDGPKAGSGSHDSHGSAPRRAFAGARPARHRGRRYTRGHAKVCMYGSAMAAEIRVGNAQLAVWGDGDVVLGTRYDEGTTIEDLVRAVTLATAAAKAMVP